LLKVDQASPNLTKEKVVQFHTFVAKGLFLCKRARSDIQPVIAFLTTRVKGPNQGYWFKLKKMMCFLKHTQEDVLALEAEDDLVFGCCICCTSRF
jgi:hypothetical protein